MGKWVLILIVGFSFLFFVLVNTTTPVPIEGDGVFYYSWLHSAFFDRDFDFANQLSYFAKYDYHSRQFTEQNIVTDINRRPNPYAFGSAIMWAPMFLVAHIFSLIFSWPADGYFWPYMLAINFASWFYGILTLYVIYKLIGLANLTAKKSALIATLGMWLATPWVYYQFFEPSMSHLPSLFLVGLFWLLTIKMWQGKTVNLWLLSVVIFLMVATRWQNMIFLLAYVPIIWCERKSIKTMVKKAVWLLLPLVAFLVVQATIWHSVYGWYLLIPQGQGFVRFEFHGLYTLFSSDRGLLLWSPILILAIIGWTYFKKSSRFFSGTILAVFFGQWAINSSLVDLGGGDAFGGRRFIETLPFLALPLAMFFDRFKKYYWPLALVLIFTIINLLLIFFYRQGVVPRSGQFDLIDALGTFFSL